VPPSWTGWWIEPEQGLEGGPRGPEHRPGAASTGTVAGVATPRAIPRVEQMVDDHRGDGPVRRIVPIPTPAATMPEAMSPAATGTGESRPSESETRPTLRRRVPQAHLAPGLRIIDMAPEPGDPSPLPVAAEALSRYQASRAVARSAVDGDRSGHDASARHSVRGGRPAPDQVRGGRPAPDHNDAPDERSTR
jgi:hypothetical protein